MPDDMEVWTHLKDLGERIDAKVLELKQQGVLHGAAREAAAELQSKHAVALKRAEAHQRSLGGKLADELSADVEILKHSFERWIASVDRRSER